MTDPIGRSFFEIATAEPDRKAVLDEDGRWRTCGELHVAANRVSHALRELGAAIGDRMAVVSANRPELLDLALGAQQAGVHLVALNPRSSVAELEHQLGDSAPVLVVSSAAAGPAVTEALQAIGAPAGRHLSLDDRGPGSLDTLLAAAPAGPPRHRFSAAPMRYTAGTTGRPKGVLWPVDPTLDPEAAQRGSAVMMARRGMTPGGTSIVTGPLYHGAPGNWALQALHHGHRLVVMPRWDTLGFLELVERYAATHAQMVPIHFHRLLQLPEAVRDRYDVGSMRAISHAGAGCPVEVKRRMLAWFGPVLYEYYAASEGAATSITPEEWLAHPGSVGHVHGDGGEVRIVGADGTPCSAGEVGEIWVRRSGPPPEYHNDPERTAQLRRGDGFWTFGDMGWVDADGWLFIADRRADMILSGGVNLYPAEIEQALASHPAVIDVAVVGVPDEEWGQRALAVVVARPGVDADDALVDDLQAHAEGAIARFKVPRAFEFRDALPYSAAGKLLRRELRDEYWPQTGVPR